MPPVKKWLSEVFVESLRKEAERRGKSLDDVLRENIKTSPICEMPPESTKSIWKPTT